MTKWLTTGQMIDKLKVNEKAEGYIITDHDSIKQMEVCKNDAHSIMVIKEWKVFEVNGITLNLEWRILPKYVSFYEAMRAHECGKTVTYHHNEDLTFTFIKELAVGQFSELSNDNICLYELIEGKWSIED